MEKMTYTKKWLFSLIVAIFLTAFAIIFVSSKVGAQPSTVAFEATATATTSLKYMTPGTATTTYQFDSSSYSDGKVLTMQGIDSASMFINFVASTTNSVLAYQFQYSNNGVDWYGESASTNTFGIAGIDYQASSTIVHEWNPAVAGTSTKAVIIPITAAQHERVQFYIPIGTNQANGAVYSEINLKRNPSTP